MVATPINCPAPGNAVGLTQASTVTLFVSLSGVGLPTVTEFVPLKLKDWPTLPAAYVTPPVRVPSLPPAISRGVLSPEYHANIFAGGATQVDRVAVAVLPVPPFVELTCTELRPPVAAVTSTEIVHGVPTATVALASDTVFEPLVAPVTLPPPQLLTLSAGVAATSIPAGKLSVNETPLSGTVLAAGLVIVNVSVEFPPGDMNVGVKAFAITGGATTFSVAVLLTFPATGVSAVATPDVVFVRFPPVELVISKITVQPAGGIVIPPKLSDVAPAEMLDGVVPTQVPVTGPPTALMSTKLSLNDAPVRFVAFGLESVRVTVVFPPPGMEEAPKAFAIVGGPRIVHTEFTGEPVFPAISTDLTLKS